MLAEQYSHNSFETFKSIKNDSKARKLDVVRVEAERRGIHMLSEGWEKLVACN